MRSKFALAVVVFAVAAVTVHVMRLEASRGPIPLNCNRACLENVVNQYLTALVAKDPKRLPLSQDLKYTENGQLLPIGDGFWKTAEGRGKYTHIFSDPEFGQVAYMGTMMEAGGPILMSLRLRIELGRLTEIENVFFRPGGGGPNDIAAMDAPHKPEDFWFKSIPPAQRMSRQELIAVADDYFTTVQKNDGKGINGTGTYPFTENCHRIENGRGTTNMPRPPAGAAGAGGGRGGAPAQGARGGQAITGAEVNAMDCLSQFKLGYFFIVQNIHGRRYPVVDQERGIVYAHCVFDQGTVNSGVLADGRPHTFPGFNRPSSILVTEAFLIENGKIRHVEMVGTSAFFHMQTPWGGLSGN
jgi:hypothetical protein